MSGGISVQDLSPAMRHVLSRCSDAQIWRSERGWSRVWLDLVHGYPHASHKTIDALVRRGLLYRDDFGFGLTAAAWPLFLELRRLANEAQR